MLKIVREHTTTRCSLTDAVVDLQTHKMSQGMDGWIMAISSEFFNTSSALTRLSRLTPIPFMYQDSSSKYIPHQPFHLRLHTPVLTHASTMRLRLSGVHHRHSDSSCRHPHASGEPYANGSPVPPSSTPVSASTESSVHFAPSRQQQFGGDSRRLNMDPESLRSGGAPHDALYTSSMPFQHREEGEFYKATRFTRQSFTVRRSTGSYAFDGLEYIYI